MAQLAIIESYVQKDRLTTTETPPCITEIDSEEPAWEQPSTVSLPLEDTIRENMRKYKEDILEWLNPSQLLELLLKFKLLKAYRRMKREQFVELLIEEVQRRNAYSVFLESLEKDVAKEHMGHWYIASLLRGQEFANEDEIQKSRTLKDRIGQNLTQFESIVDVNDKNFGPALFEAQLVTQKELKDLRSRSSSDSAIDLFLLLDTKGPTAHYTLCTEVLAKDPVFYGDLLKLLGTPQTTRKRKASNSSIVPSPKYYHPSKFKPPEGLQTMTYLVRISKVRQYHQIGEPMWCKIEEMCMEMATSTKHPLEVRIAFLLESCNTLIARKKSELIFNRVERAADMCKELTKHCDTHALDARRQWVLAKYYRCSGDYDKAQQHIDAAFRLLANCLAGEEHILVNYDNGVLRLNKDSDDSSADQRTVAIQSLQSALSHASDNDYGLKIFHYDIIRQAQAHLGISSAHPQSNKDQVTDKDIKEAKKALDAMVRLDKGTEETLEEVNEKLRALDREEMKPRIWCMFLCTWSDVYRLSGDRERAIEYAELALHIADADVKDSIQKRLAILQETD